MSDTTHSPIAFFLGKDGYLLRCTCGEEAEVEIILEGPTDYEELELLATEEAGWSEMGACPFCERQHAAEEAADAAMRDRKAGMEATFNIRTK